MTVPNQDNQVAMNDKEMNFRKQAAMYERQIEQERNEKAQILRELEEARSAKNIEEEIVDEPYVDHKRLAKSFNQFGEKVKKETKSEINQAVQLALQEERKNNWMKQNGDFYDVLKHAEKLAMHDPELADTILEMPESFERQKLVYKNIKALGLHQEKPKESSIQEKIDANRRSPYYQPSGVGTAPYKSHSDFSSAGQEQAYNKMQELKKNIRL